jgi:hypothetical protein
MSAAAAEGMDNNTSQMEAALADSPEGAFDHDSDDDFQYEEVEVPR